MKKVFMMIGAVLLVVLVAAGGFWSGMTYESNRTAQAQANFFNARGGAADGQFPGNGEFPGDAQRPPGTDPNSGQGPGAFGGRGTTGEVKTVDENVLILSTAQDVTTVTLSGTTQIVKSETGALSDLQPGMRVTITGQKDNGGNLTAERIQILDQDLTGPAYPAPEGMTP